LIYLDIALTNELHVTIFATQMSERVCHQMM